MAAMKDYTISGNPDVLRLIENYDLTYTQARRYQMRKDGMEYKEIARIEGASIPSIQSSYDLAKRKIGESGALVVER
jgi:DNA-binding CsgD family transcriptional regulator